MGVNKTFLVGRVGKEPVVSEKEGNKMTRFSLATNENYYDSDHNKKEKTEWHNVVAFGSRAGVCEKYLKKGSMVHIEGRNATRTYKKDDQTHYITEIQVNDIQFLDSRD